MMHEKRKDHTCPHCAAAFGKASHLTVHVRTVHHAPHCKRTAEAARASGGAGSAAALLAAAMRQPAHLAQQQQQQQQRIERGRAGAAANGAVAAAGAADAAAAVALVQLVAGRGGEDEKQAVEAGGGDSDPEWVGEGLILSTSPSAPSSLRHLATLGDVGVPRSRA